MNPLPPLISLMNLTLRFRRLKWVRLSVLVLRQLVALVNASLVQESVPLAPSGFWMLSPCSLDVQFPLLESKLTPNPVAVCSLYLLYFTYLCLACRLDSYLLLRGNQLGPVNRRAHIEALRLEDDILLGRYLAFDSDIEKGNYTVSLITRKGRCFRLGK